VSVFSATMTALLATFPVVFTSVVAPGAGVIVVGSGPIQCLTARLAAIKGYKTTLAAVPNDAADPRQLVFDATYPEGSLPLDILPVAGDAADGAKIEACIADAEGLIVCFDGEQTMPEAALNVFAPLEAQNPLKHVSIMSRYLNGAGMGFTVSAAKAAANPEIWNGNSRTVEALRAMESQMTARARAIGSDYTIVRAGTLKGGASGEGGKGDLGGESTFLAPYFYSLGQQDIVNWRLLYDCGALGVDLVRGDTLPGPGFTAALTACSEEGGKGDSHRGAVATALVESLSAPAAANADFSVASKKGRSFPQPAEWPAMFAGA